MYVKFISRYMKSKLILMTTDIVKYLILKVTFIRYDIETCPFVTILLTPPPPPLLILCQFDILVNSNYFMIEKHVTG